MKWYFGITPTVGADTNFIDTGRSAIFGLNILSFNPFETARIFKCLDFTANIVNMSDSEGNLLFYFNGAKVFNSQHRLMDEGDSFNFNDEWDALNGYFASFSNGFFSHNSMAIPDLYNPDLYYLFNIYFPWQNSTASDDRVFTRIQYSIIDMRKNNGLGKVILKEKILDTGNYTKGIYATKKSNGKDWWLLVRDFDSTGCINLLSLDSSGIKLMPKKQCIGYPLYSKFDTTNKEHPYNVWNGGCFSPDGKKFAFLSSSGIEIFNFNRCTGHLSKFFTQKYYDIDSGLKVSNFENDQPIFSSNSRFLYLIYQSKIYQLDMNVVDIESSLIKVAVNDSHFEMLPPDATIFYSTFATAQLAPDKKIYIGTNYSNHYLHVIENPDEKGLACDIRQHSIKLKAIKTGIPYYPNYSLGEDYSSCWGVGIQSTDNSEQIAVYPNPARDKLYIKGLKNSINYEIYDIIGKRITNGKTRENIDITKLNKGIYFLKINEDKKQTNLKFEVLK